MKVSRPDRKWVAYSRLYQSLEVDSSVLLQQLTSIEYHWHQLKLPHQQVSNLHTHSLKLKPPQHADQDYGRSGPSRCSPSRLSHQNFVTKQNRRFDLRSCLVETGARGFSSWFPSVRIVFGGQIQRHLPPDSVCDSKAAHATQVGGVRTLKLL